MRQAEGSLLLDPMSCGAACGLGCARFGQAGCRGMQWRLEALGDACSGL